MFRWNPKGDYPQINNSAYVDPTVVIIGKVSIGRNVFIGPTVVIRADEPDSLIIIKDNCNVQDRVIIHALEGSSVLIEENSSLAHGCIVHGPCKIGKNCFIGFGSVVFKSKIGEKSLIKHLAVIEKVNVFSGRVVESGQLVNCKDNVRELRYADERDKVFMEKVIKVNLNLVKGYSDNQRGAR